MNELFVLKIGGGVLRKDSKLLKDIINCKNPAIIIHGGGRVIDRNLKKRKLQVKFINGLRYTDKEVLKVVKETLENINEKIVKSINENGKDAIGIFAHMVRCKRVSRLGYVGKPYSVEKGIFEIILREKILPVIYPISFDEHDELINVNADEISGAISKCLSPQKLFFFTDTDGVYDKNGKRIPHISCRDIDALIKEKVVTAGMIPKLSSAKFALEGETKEVWIVNEKNGLTPKSGTLITK